MIDAGSDKPPNAPSTVRLGVCHVASGDRWAGAEVQVSTLLKFLALDPRLELCAVILNRGRLAEAIEQQGTPVMVIPEDHTSIRGIVRQAAPFLSARKIQVIHSHRYKENLIGAWLARRCGIPYCVRTQHGMPEPQSGHRVLKQGIIQRVDKLVGRYATDRVISVSHEMHAKLVPQWGARRVVTIHNGIDIELVKSSLSKAEAKDRLGVHRESWLFGTAGRLEPVKRLDIFLEAAGHIAARLPNSRFAIAGNGGDELKLRDIANRAGLLDRVLFLGHRDDVCDVLRAFDVFILCSDHEGLPMVLLEALCLGVPVVARPVGGITEVLQDGLTGVLVDPCEPTDLARACVQIIGDEPRRTSLARNGIDLVKESFSINHTAKLVAELYLSLAGTE